MIKPADVKTVAKDIFKRELTLDQIANVLKQYPSQQEEDPTGTWNLVVEHILHSIIDIDNEDKKSYIKLSDDVISDLKNEDDDYIMDAKECSQAIEVLQMFGRWQEYQTGMRMINGGYAFAVLYDYDDEDAQIELEWGEQNMGDGRSSCQKECYTLDREVLKSDIPVKEKVEKIKST